ncbi:MAG: 16S rRNA (guanine(527)-N(7))-methyltransferase RsmG [Nitrospirota bacterium]
MDIEGLLERGLKELGHVPEMDIVRSFMTYLTELKRWNRAYNLTSLKKDEDIVIKHFLDSLLYLKVMPEGEIRVADVGSGAGFPGIPIEIIRPEIEMYLIEPSRKKSAFLRHIIRQLELKGIEVIEKRIEDVRVVRESYPLKEGDFARGALSPLRAVDVAVTRALFSIRDFIKKASPLVRKGGILILNKGPKVKEEINMLRGIKYELLTLSLPLSDIKRYIVIVSPQNRYSL